MTAIAWALISTEAIKLRRTFALWMVLVTPVVVCALELASLLDRDLAPRGTPAEMWRELLQAGWIWWLALIVPMLICLEAASLAGVEHGGRVWKQLFSLPIPRWSVYATKILFCGALVGFSFLVVAVGFIADGLIYSGIRGLHLASEIPLGEILGIAGKGFLACWTIIVIQNWISVRFRGMAAAIGIGFAALAIGFVYLAILNRHMENFMSFYPWLMPFRILPIGRDVHNTLLPVVAGGVGGVVLLVVACWDLSGRVQDG